jgi:hypothetical protein
LGVGTSLLSLCACLSVSRAGWRRSLSICGDNLLILYIKNDYLLYKIVNSIIATTNVSWLVVFSEIESRLIDFEDRIIRNIILL